MSPTVSFGMGSTLKNMKTINLPNDDVYEGELNYAGEFTGYGKYIFKRENMEYLGHFLNGMQHGRGKLFKLTHPSRRIIGSSTVIESLYEKAMVYDG